MAGNLERHGSEFPRFSFGFIFLRLGAEDVGNQKCQRAQTEKASQSLFSPDEGPGRCSPKHPRGADPAHWRMRRTDASRQPSRDRRRLHSGHSLGKALLPRHHVEILGSSYRASLPEGRQEKQLPGLQRVSGLTSSFRFVGRFQSRPFTSGALRSAAAGSCVRRRRSRCAPGIFS